jgi:peptidoglycan/LPS O-acetylase OafA/YrhL
VLAAAVAAREGSLVHRVLTVRPLLAIGKYSYAMYLLHIPLRDELRDIVGGKVLPQIFGSQIPVQVALLAVGIVVPYFVAVASWHLFEKHFLALKRYFEYRPAVTAEAPAPVAHESRHTPAPMQVNA